MKSTEIKYRGPLTPEQLRGLQAYLHQRAMLISHGWERVFFFDTTIFPQVGDFDTGFSRMSLKLDTKGISIRIKEGNPSSALRYTRKISLKKEELPNLLFLLDALGLHQGFYRPAYRRRFTLRRLKLSIKTECAIGDHFEVELSGEDDLELPLLKDVFSRFGLWCWTKTEYQECIREGMRRFPAISVKELEIAG